MVDTNLQLNNKTYIFKLLNHEDKLSMANNFNNINLNINNIGTNVQLLVMGLNMRFVVGMHMVLLYEIVYLHCKLIMHILGTCCSFYLYGFALKYICIF